MTKAQLATLEKNLEELLADRVDIEAFDGDVLVLSVKSFTEEGLKHRVDADFQTGLAKCFCMEATKNARVIDFTDGTGFPCKHLLLAMFFIKPFYTAAIKEIFIANKAKKKSDNKMEAFGYQPRYWPPEDHFEMPVLSQQKAFFRAFRDNGSYTSKMFAAFYEAVCTAFGLIDDKTMGHAAVVIDFIKSANRNQFSAAMREAEKNA